MKKGATVLVAVIALAVWASIQAARSAAAGDPEAQPGKVKTVTIVPGVQARWNRSHWDNGDNSCLFFPVHMALADPADPGPGKFRVGFHNLTASYSSCNWYDGLVYRGILAIPQSQLAFPGHVQKATLRFSQSNSATPLSGPWKLSVVLITRDAGFASQGSPIVSLSGATNAVDLTEAVASWKSAAGKNKGLLFIGPDESCRHDNAASISTFGDFKLEIEYLAQ